MSAAYVDTSAVLRPVLERGLDTETERALSSASILFTSRLTLVESARVLARLRVERKATEVQLADANRQLEAFWSRCHIYEVTSAVCELAGRVAPHLTLRALDALHLATWVLVRQRFDEVTLITADRRLREAAGTH